MDEVVTVEISSPQVESSNMLDIIAEDMWKLDDQSGSQDNQHEQQSDMKIKKSIIAHNW